MRTKIAQQKHNKSLAKRKLKRKQEHKLMLTMDRKSWAYRKAAKARKQYGKRTKDNSSR